MRSTSRLLAVSLLAVSLPLFSQTASRTRRSTPPAAKSAAAAAPCPTTPAVPHSIAWTVHRKITTTQPLVDGTTATNTITTVEYRDSQGRSRTETTTMQNGTPFTSVRIFDPVTRTNLSWNTSNTTATLTHQRVVTQQTAIPQPQVNRRFYPTTTVALPPETIAGVYATGNRTTRTTPAGFEGNDHDITTTSENWFAPDIGLQLRFDFTDIHGLKQHNEVTDFTRGDPDPALFQPPAGYTVHDNNPPQ